MLWSDDLAAVFQRRVYTVQCRYGNMPLDGAGVVSPDQTSVPAADAVLQVTHVSFSY